MATEDVYQLPDPVCLDGINLPAAEYKLLLEKRLDDVRMKAGEDTVIATYPRTGTTWVCQIVSLLLVDEVKYAAAKQIPIDERALYLEWYDESIGLSRIDQLPTIPTPRPVKTHLPYRFIRRWVEEDRVKTIVTTRNPKDTLVSLFHFFRARAAYAFSGTWDDFFRHFQAGHVLYGDQYDWLRDWAENVGRSGGGGAGSTRDVSVLVVQYEAMKRDLRREIERIVAFLGLDVSETRVQNVIRDSGIRQMKHDLHAMEGFVPGSFVRSGLIGGWKKQFTVEQNEWFDNKYKKLYEELDINVEYE